MYTCSFRIEMSHVEHVRAINYNAGVLIGRITGFARLSFRPSVTHSVCCPVPGP